MVDLIIVNYGVTGSQEVFLEYVCRIREFNVTRINIKSQNHYRRIWVRGMMACCKSRRRGKMTNLNEGVCVCVSESELYLKKTNNLEFVNKIYILNKSAVRRLFI